MPNATGDIANWTEPLGLCSLLVESFVVAIGVAGTSVVPGRAILPHDPPGSFRASSQRIPRPIGFSARDTHDDPGPELDRGAQLGQLPEHGERPARREQRCA
jgi:hypothetical protein